MTIEGTVNKTVISLLLLMATASYPWVNESLRLMILGFIGGFIMALRTILSNMGTLYGFKLCTFRGLGSWWNIACF